MKIFILLILFNSFFFLTFSQTNMLSTNADAENLMKGNYDPNNYMPTIVINNPDSIVKLISQQISSDSLHGYLDALATFYTRNSASDTLSDSVGIGAARRWAFHKFSEFSARNNNRLIPSYLQFDAPIICGIQQHRDIFAVLPGADTSDKYVVLVEGHIDTRCKDNCDINCLAQGMEDNASGTALVLELARVMSKCVFNRTIIFLLPIGEEQGLYGASAFVQYALAKSIRIHAVLNNDIVGGIICGNTSSAPSCPGYGNVDSTHVRLFSFGGFNSPHKQFARFVKLEYKEEALQHVSVPTDILILTPEDRSGRGGDHIPFRQNQFTAIRMTSVNENGSAATSDPNYHDRQHTSDDILGVNTDLDPAIDSFFVNFNYLSRNTVINATAIGMAAIGPLTPDFTVTSIDSGNTYNIFITNQTQYNQYRVGVRTTTNDWDSVYTFSNSLGTTIVLNDTTPVFFSVASVDNNGVESLFSEEKLRIFEGVNSPKKISNGILLLPNTPNPADEKTLITILSDKDLNSQSAYVSITDTNGKEIKNIPIQIHQGVNEVIYNHGSHTSGIFNCTLYVNGEKNNSVKMIFKN